MENPIICHRRRRFMLNPRLYGADCLISTSSTQLRPQGTALLLMTSLLFMFWAMGTVM